MGLRSDAHRRFLLAFIVLSGGPLAACFSGVKHVREGEPCITGDQVFAGSVECAGGLTCLASRLYAAGGRSGTCARTCDEQRPCPARLVCAAGACAPPCSEGCGAFFEFSGVCCGFLEQGLSACLPAVACDQSRGARDGGSYGPEDAASAGGSGEAGS